jgi:hypothetical protein
MKQDEVDGLKERLVATTTHLRLQAERRHPDGGAFHSCAQQACAATWTLVGRFST